MTTDAAMVLVPQPRMRFFDQNGVPLAGAKVFTYEPGTTTKMTTYTDSTGLTPNTNPIVLDSNGECDMWIPPLAPFTVEALPPGPPGPPGIPGPAGPPGATGNTAEFSETVDIDSETIYNGFFGAYINISPAEVDGVAYIPVMIVLGFHYRTVPYDTNGANFVVNWGPPTFPSAVPNCTILASILESGTDKILILPQLDGLNGSLTDTVDMIGKPLTITLDAAPTGPPLIAAGIADPGEDYAPGDQILVDGGDGLAEFTVDTVDGDGAVTALIFVAGGAGYSSDTGVATTTDGAGSGLTLDTTSAETTSGSLRVTTYYRKFTPIPA